MTSAIATIEASVKRDIRPQSLWSNNVNVAASKCERTAVYRGLDQVIH